MSTVHHVTDFAGESIRREAAEPGRKVIEYTPAGYKYGPWSIVRLNDRSLRGAELCEIEIAEGDQLVFSTAPGIIGAAAAGAAGFAPSAAAAASGPSLGAAAGGLSIAGSLGAGVLTSLAGFVFSGIASTFQSEPRVLHRYGTFLNQADFEGRQPTVGEGTEVPFVYGKVEVTAHIVETFEQDRLDIIDPGLPLEQNLPTGGQIFNIPRTTGRLAPGQPMLSTRLVAAIGPVKSLTVTEISGRPKEEFPGLTLHTRVGSPENEPIVGFQQTRVDKIENRPVTVAGGAETFVTDIDVDTIEVVVVFPDGFHIITTKSIILNFGVDITFEYRRLGEVGWNSFGTFTNQDLTFTQRTFRIKLPDFSSRGIHEVRVTRVTPDSVDPNKVNNFEVESLAQITYEARNHPGLAQVAAFQLSREHQIETAPNEYRIEVEGFNNIRVYSDLVTYVEQYTQNPAWICANLITNTRIGLGRFFTYSDIDIQSFIDWADYCDELVDDGEGGTAARAQFDYEFRVEETMESILDRMTSGADAFLIFVDGKWKAIVDNARTTMVQIFHPGNILGGTYEQRWIPPSQRPLDVSAVFQDRTKGYAEDFLKVEDPNTTALTPVAGRVFDLRHVTREFQVARQLNKLKLRNEHQTKEISFAAGLSALHVLPGDLIGVAMPVSQETIRAGQVIAVSADNRTITIDGQLDIETGKTYELTIAHKVDNLIETRVVDNAPESDVSHIRITTVLPFAQLVEVGDAFSVAEVFRSVEKYQVLKTQIGADFVKEIQAILYSDAVHSDALPFQVDATPRAPGRFSLLSDAPPAATDLVLNFRQPQDSAGNTFDVIDVDWNAPISMNIREFQIHIREKNTGDDWHYAGSTNGRRFEIKRNHFETGGAKTYQVIVQAVSVLGNATSVDDSPLAEILIT